MALDNVDFDIDGSADGARPLRARPTTRRSTRSRRSSWASLALTAAHRTLGGLDPETRREVVSSR